MFKAQTSIDSFFTGNSNKNKYEINRYFYLSWTNKYKPDFNAFWTNKKPEKINFVWLCDSNLISHINIMINKYE